MARERNVQSPGHAMARTYRAIEPGMLTGEVAARSIRAKDGLANVISGLGQKSRDKTTHNYYGFPRFLTRTELDNMYRGSWLAKRIVNTVADDLTREWREFTFEDQDDNANHDLLLKAEKDFQVKRKFNHALRWARLYGGAIIVLGVGDDDLSTPLKVENVKKGDLRYMHVLDRWRVSAQQLNTDVADPNFGKPDIYVVAESSVQVHHTRVLRFNGEELPYFPWTANAYWDDSVIQHVLNVLENSDSNAAHIAAMMFEASMDVIQGSDIADTLATEDGESQITKRFQLAMLMKSVMRTLVLDKDETYAKVQTQFANLDKVQQNAWIEVCGAAEMPMTILFGQSAAGLSATGEEDTRGYYDKCSADQETDVRPQLDYFDEIFVRSTLGAMPPDYKYDFKTLWQIDDTEQATIDYQNAQRDQIYVNIGAATEGLIASELKARGTYRTMSQDDVDLAEELANQPDPTPVGVIAPGQAQPAPGSPAAGVGQGTPGAKGQPAKKRMKIKRA